MTATKILRAEDESGRFQFSVLDVQPTLKPGSLVALVTIAVDGHPMIQRACCFLVAKGAWVHKPAHRDPDDDFRSRFFGSIAVQTVLLPEISDRLGRPLPRKILRREKVQRYLVPTAARHIVALIQNEMQHLPPEATSADLLARIRTIRHELAQ